MATQKLKTSSSSTFSFGSTSAIITNIALIIGLDTTLNAKATIIGSLLVIALADNISDTLGMHMFQESEGHSKKTVWLLTFTNFFSRLLTSLGFILIIFIFPLSIGIIVGVVYGLSILTLVSYLIAKNRKVNPWSAIAEHLLIAMFVIVISKLFGGLILKNFHSNL